MDSVRSFLLGLGFSRFEAGRLSEIFGDSEAVISFLETPNGRSYLGRIVEPSSVRAAHMQFTRIWNGTNLYSSLEPFGVPTEDIYRFFLECNEDENECLKILASDPYRLVFDVHSPFPAVDKASVIFDCENGSRTEAAVYAGLLLAEHGMEESGYDSALGQTVSEVAGSTCLPVGKLLEIAGLLLGDSDAEAILAAAKRLHCKKKLLLTKKVLDGEKTLVAIRLETAKYEFAAGEIIKELLASERPAYSINPYKAIDDAQYALGLHLSYEQAGAVHQALTNRISVLTGGPGTGKTQTVKILLEAFRRLSGNGKVQLMAPTGQAAKRMEASTGCKASTIHSALGIYPGETDPSKASDIYASLIVVDECSMIDTSLFSMLLQHIGNAILVVAGDVDQLPSIGAGNVLTELIKCVPTTRLTKIFRQDGDAADIAYNAARIKAGSARMIESERFSFIEADSSAEIQKAVCDVYSKEVESVGLDNVIVLTPLRRKTMTGVNQLNKVLRKTCSEEKRYVAYGDTRIYQNDKIIFLKNRYGLSNGSHGFVTRVGQDYAECSFDGKKVTLSGSQLSWIVPAYAETIHKSQGDEYRVVILVADKNHSATKSMIYTAITRAKDKLICVGAKDAFWAASRNCGGQRCSLISSLVLEGQA